MRKTTLTILSAAAFATSLAFAEAQPDPTTLIANQSVAKAQAVGVITTFMGTGAQTCDASGENCHSMFGSDDTPDFTTLQSKAQSTTGIQTFAFDDANSQGGAGNVSVQMGSVAIACGDSKPHIESGVAVKLSHCAVSTNGDVQIKYRICTAPSRNLPVTPVPGAVYCSDNPADANFHPPPGKSCVKASCDSELVGSLNGWSDEQTLTWIATLPPTASDNEKSQNGLGLSFYPPLGGGMPPDFKADSDTLTAVKVVASFANSQTGRTAVGLKVAYRKKAVITKDQISAGAQADVTPRDHTELWDTMLKLQGDARIPQLGAKYAKNGSECIQQVTAGLATDGKITVCDQEYNENGLKPIARTAQIAAEGANCGAVQKCIQEVVNTNTWTETCKADVPLAVRACTTETPVTSADSVCKRSMGADVCHERRSTAEYTCQVEATANNYSVPACVPGTRLVNVAQQISGLEYYDPYMLLRVTCDAPNRIHVQYSTSVSGHEFDAYYYDAKVDDFVPWILVDVVLTADAFQSMKTKAGYVCASGYDRGIQNNFEISCNSTQCEYRISIPQGGDCPLSDRINPNTAGTYPVYSIPSFAYSNSCTYYENAR